LFRITKRKEMAGGKIIQNDIEAPRIARKARPGQFVILKANETGERIPLTIASADPDSGTITVIYAVVGRSTKRFSELREGEFYQDLTGPLGKAAHLEHVGTVVCVGGGTGVAVLYPMVKELKRLGNRVISIEGARTGELMILEEEMAAASDELLICTNDGSRGRCGLVTDLLIDVLAKERVDLVVSVGPVQMMKRVSEITKPIGVKTIVSLNPIMIDGTGMCGGCRVLVNGEPKFACVDGPEFDGHEVDFDQLLQRLQAYRSIEDQTTESLQGSDQHRCRMQSMAAAAVR
jgi:ferredoxin--NADP+ reductase